MPLSESDPRVFFAAERTLLAWLRTGLTIIGIGFVVARFGLFMRILSLQLQHPHESSPMSGLLGIGFVLVGSVSIFAAVAQHQRFIATLAGPDLPPAYSGRVALYLCVIVATLGLLLAGYLLVSSV